MQAVLVGSKTTAEGAALLEYMTRLAFSVFYLPGLRKHQHLLA